MRICICVCVGVFGRGILGGGPLCGGGAKEECHEAADCMGGEVPFVLPVPWEAIIGGRVACR